MKRATGFSRRIAAFIFVLALLFGFARHAAALNLPACSGYVMDSGGALDPGTSQQLTALLDALDKKTTAQVAVAVVDSLEGTTVEDYAQKLFDKCRFGQKGKDNGMLFLVALTDRKMRIHVGYGLEGAMNDAKAGHLLDTEVTPRFKAGDMNGGVLAGTTAIVDVVAKEYNLTLNDLGGTPAPAEPEGAHRVQREMSWWALVIMLFGIFLALPAVGKIIVIVVIVLAIILIIKDPGCFFGLLFGLLSGGGGGGSGGGFGGSFGGFGGGMSGGGGSSRGW